MNYNKVMLGGNLTRDPELRYTPKGTAVAEIGLAINRVWTTETGEKKEEVTFVNCAAFGRTAETLGQYVRKGHPLFIEGRLKLEQWDDKQTGQKRSAIKIIIEGFQFIKPAGEGDREERTPARRETPAGKPAATGGRDTMGDGPPPSDDDVPF